MRASKKLSRKRQLRSDTGKMYQGLSCAAEGFRVHVTLLKITAGLLLPLVPNPTLPSLSVHGSSPTMYVTTPEITAVMCVDVSVCLHVQRV